MNLLKLILLVTVELCGMTAIVMVVRFLWWRSKRDDDFAELLEQHREEQARIERAAQEKAQRERAVQEQARNERMKREPSPTEWTRRAYPARIRATESIPPNGIYRRGCGLFGPWPLYIHQDEEQYNRFIRSKCQPIQLKLADDQTYTVIGTTGVYRTSLRSCTCMDFRKNQQGQAPCKHMYFLARQCGYDVDAIFRSLKMKREFEKAVSQPGVGRPPFYMLRSRIRRPNLRAYCSVYALPPVARVQ